MKMRFAIFGLLLTLSLPHLLVGETLNVAGNWEGEWESRREHNRVVFHLKQENNKVGGTFDHWGARKANMFDIPVEGSLEGDNLQLNIVGVEGGRVKAKVTGDTMEGSYRNPVVSQTTFAFRVQRVK